MMIANVFNYLFQVILGRMLNPTDYGTLNALLSLFTVLSVFSSLFSLAAARETSYYHTLGQDDHVRKVIRTIFFIAIGFSAFFLICGALASTQISEVLHIDNPLLVQFTVLVVAANGLYPVFAGVLQGLKRFVPYSLTGVLIASVKLVLSICFIWLGWRLYGVLAALLISGILTLVFCLVRVSGFYQVTANLSHVHIDNRSLLKYLNSVFWVQTLTVFVTNCDILLVKSFAQDAEDAGIYSSGMVIGKIAMYVASAVIAALFPMVAEASARKEDPRPLYLKTMLYGGGIALFSTLCINLFGPFIIRLLFGGTYLAVVPLLLPIGVLVLAYTFIIIQMNYLVALNHTRLYGMSLGIGCILIASLISLFHSTTTQILYIISMVLYMVFIINLINILHQKPESVQS